MMKKIISLLSVFAMVLTMLSTVAFADENNKVYWEDISPEGATTVTLKLVAQTSYTLDKIQVSYDLANLYAGNVAFTATDLADCTVFNNGTSTAKTLALTYTNLDGFTGTLELATLELDFTNATVDSVTLPQKKAMSATNGTTKYQSYFSNEAAGYTVTKPVVEDEEPEYGVSAAQDYYYSADGGATKDIEVKAWDVVAENDGTGFVSLYFSSASENVTNKKYTAKHSVEGETAVEFKALMLNAPADLTCALTAAN